MCGNIKNAKSFWRKLRYLSGKQTTHNSITSTEWKEHFESLFSPCDDNFDFYLDPTYQDNITDFEDEVFNSPITDEVILILFYLYLFICLIEYFSQAVIRNQGDINCPSNYRFENFITNTR